MTDRFFSLTVALGSDIRSDDAQCLIDAIKLMRGAVDVSGNVTDMSQWSAEVKIKAELQKKLWEVLK